MNNASRHRAVEKVKEKDSGNQTAGNGGSATAVLLPVAIWSSAGEFHSLHC